jgi:hypothetical protein
MAVKSDSCQSSSSVEVRSPHPAIRFPDRSGRDLQAVLHEADAGTVIELAPGRYEGPLNLRRPVTLKGAGDLTRLVSLDGPAVTISPEGTELVFLESLALEGPEGIRVRQGRVRLYNVHVTGARSHRSGGGLAVEGGEVEGALVRIEDCTAARGGGLAAYHRARVVLRDAQFRECEAETGGALWLANEARVDLVGATLAQVRARRHAGGQAMWLGDPQKEGPCSRLERVRFEDAPFGRPLVMEPEGAGRVVVVECDLPSDVSRISGVVDDGNNRWR